MSKLWTKEEEHIVIWNYTFKNPINDWIHLLPNRSRRSIINKAYNLNVGRKNFTDDEKQYVRDNYKSWNLKEIALYLDTSPQNACRLAKELGVKRTGKMVETRKTYEDENGVTHPVGWKRKTKQEIAQKRSQIMKEWHKRNKHPKGMLGKTHSEKYKKELSIKAKMYWENVTDEELEKRRKKQRETRIKNDTLVPACFKKNPYSRTKSGKREDLNNMFFRSSWEANIARYYNYMNIKWEYEIKRFIFDNVGNGPASYMPDFYLPEKDIWVEVKGWMDKKSKNKLESFEKYYPNEYKKLYLIDQKEYFIIEKEYKQKIENWE